jgi:hypothetical protein
MSAVRDRRPGLGQRGIPGLEDERLSSRQPPRTTDPLRAPDACAACEGTGVDVDTPELDGVCHSCHGTGWAS